MSSARPSMPTSRKKVEAGVGNRVPVAKEPIPTDVGEVGWSTDDYNMQAEETEIGMVVSAWTKCHRCEGYGHLPRDAHRRQGQGEGRQRRTQMGDGKGGHQYQQQQEYQHHHEG